jgi:phenylpropionate dioxygenase-like ring-hydroxylating dioxygenase large terminal subunit
MLLRNSWYVAASDAEIGSKPFARTILGEPVVLFRTQSGTPVAFEDRCPHRHLPLSMGSLVGDQLQCHYHGLRFTPDGRCMRIPGQDHIPAAAKAKTYLLVERYRWIWIWFSGWFDRSYSLGSGNGLIRLARSCFAWFCCADHRYTGLDIHS